MFKKEVKCKDYNNNDVTKVLYFHLSKFEWLELETFTKGGLIENLQDAIEKGDAKKTINILRKIILTAYGEKNVETGEFEKNEDLSVKFSKSEEFSELFMELAYDAKASEAFFLGLVPQEVRDDVKREMEKKAHLSVVSEQTNPVDNVPTIS